MGVLPHTRSLCSPVQDFHIRSRARFIQPQVLAQLTEKWMRCLDASWGGLCPMGAAPRHHTKQERPQERTWSRDAAREA